jgi:hypothetical protein
MYLRLFESYVHWLEAHGRSERLARFIAICGLTTAAMVNLATVPLFFQMFHGPGVLGWLVERVTPSFFRTTQK